MSEFVLHPDAFSDLEEIWEFIAADTRVLLIGRLKKFMKQFARLRVSRKWASFVPI